jgi:hypothetical protein
VLKATAGHAMNRTALHVLRELLKADEAQLQVDQTRKEQQQTKGRKEAKSKKKAEAIPTQNGEQDSMSISSGIVQVINRGSLFNGVEQQSMHSRHRYLSSKLMWSYEVFWGTGHQSWGQVLVSSSPDWGERTFLMVQTYDLSFFEKALSMRD